MTQSGKMHEKLSFRDFMIAEDVILNDDYALLKLSENILTDSILKGGSDASQAIKDIYEIAEKTVEYTIDDHKDNIWYHHTHPKYALSVVKNVNIIKHKGQSITIRNNGKKAISVFCVTRIDNDDFTVLSPKTVEAGHSFTF